MFDTGTLDGVKWCSCFPELCFLQFSVPQVLVGLRMQFINNFVFPSWACAAGFNNNDDNVVIFMRRCSYSALAWTFACQKIA